jgi:hypothetical protein
MKTISNFIDRLLEYENPTRDRVECVVVLLCIAYLVGQIVRASL